jgi:hypothetical protein
VCNDNIAFKLAYRPCLPMQVSHFFKIMGRGRVLTIEIGIIYALICGQVDVVFIGKRVIY